MIDCIFLFSSYFNLLRVTNKNSRSASIINLVLFIWFVAARCNPLQLFQRHFTTRPLKQFRCVIDFYAVNVALLNSIYNFIFTLVIKSGIARQRKRFPQFKMQNTTSSWWYPTFNLGTQPKRNFLFGGGKWKFWGAMASHWGHSPKKN